MPTKCRLESPILITGAAVALFLLTSCSNGVGPPPQAPRAVLVEAVESPTVAGARFSGELRAADRSDLAFEIGGPVTAIHVDLGDRFNGGALLAQLDDRQPRLDLAARRANLVEAQATLDDARLNHDRRAALAGTGAVSQSSIDQAKARVESARARVDALRAEVGRAEERLADTRLLAPFAGEVVARLAEPSEVVSGGRPVLRVIGDGARLEAVIFVPSRIRERLSAARPVGVTVPTRDLTVTGEVLEIGAEANAAGLFPITLSIVYAPPSLRPGESIEARIAVGSEAVLSIPLTAFVPDGDGEATIFVVDSAATTPRAIARRVRLGALRDDSVEILDGVERGELIVAKGADLLIDGESVQPVSNGRTRYNL